VNCSIIFTEMPVLERPAAAAAAGFSAVEFWWPFTVPNPTQEEVDAFIAAIRNSGVSLVGLNFFAGDMSAGERGILSCVARETEFVQNVEWIRYIARETGCRAFNALYGLRLPDETPEEQDATALRRLRELESFTNDMSATVLLEPLSGLDGYPLKSARDALNVIEEVRRSGSATNVKLLLDVFHLSLCGDDVSADISEFADTIAHVQVADAPGRHEPGTGDLPIRRWLQELDDVGYGGFVAFEYVPSSPSEPDFSWLDTEL
jgi:hydroxypyruvate isomerase